MRKNIEIIDKVISKLSANFLIVLFSIIAIGMLFINSVYLYIDMPDFKMNNILNYLGIFINMFVAIILVIINKYLKEKFPENKYINKILFAIYIIAEFVFLKMVPLKPFSDMFFVTDIALSDFKNQMQYLQTCPNNLPIAIIFNLIFKIVKYDVFVLKVLNIICNVTTIYFAYKIYKNIYKRENRMVLLLGICSISAFLYINNVYNDIIFTTLTTIILYLVTKEKNTLKETILISILAFLQFIIRPVGIILIIAICMYFILKNKDIKKVLILISIFLVSYIIYLQIQNLYIPKSEDVKEYPVWSYIQMGINEEEFGFQNSSHSAEWSFEDVKNRIKDLGATRLIKLLAKKQYWLWSEGSYQVGRYAFGVGDVEQFFYDTPVTKLVHNPEHSKVRKALDYLMKGQYFVLLVLSLIDLIIKEKDDEVKDKKQLLYYFIIGLFCFYMIWEMKSRYIYCLYPLFLIFASSGIEKLKKIKT